MKTRIVLDAMTRTQTDEYTFFRAAHIFCFGVDAIVTNEVAQFKLHAITPPWVLQYAMVVLNME